RPGRGDRRAEGVVEGHRPVDDAVLEEGGADRVQLDDALRRGDGVVDDQVLLVVVQGDPAGGAERLAGLNVVYRDPEGGGGGPAGGAAGQPPVDVAVAGSAAHVGAVADHPAVEAAEGAGRPPQAVAGQPALAPQPVAQLALAAVQAVQPLPLLGVEALEAL